MADLEGLQLLRVKRRRDETVPDLLIVQQVAGTTGAAGANDLQKRQRREVAETLAAAGVASPSVGQGSMRRATSAVMAQQLSRQLSAGLNLTSNNTPALGSPVSKPPTEQATEESQPTMMRRRYVRVQTLHRGALQGMAPDALKQLLCSWKEAARSQISACNQGTSNGAAGPVQTEAERSQLQYKLLGCKRPLTSTLQAIASSPALQKQSQGALHTAHSVGSSHSGGGRSGLRSSSWRQGSASPVGSPSHSHRSSLGNGPNSTVQQDPLGSLCAVIDVQAQAKTNTENGSPAQKRIRRGVGAEAGAANSAQQPQQQQPAGAAPMPAGQLEELLKSTFLPMLEEYMGVPTVPPVPPTPESEHAGEARHYKQPGGRKHLTGQAVNSPRVSAERQKQQRSLPSSPAIPAQAAHLPSSTQPASGAAVQGAVQEEEDEDEMVYDVYIPLPMDNAEENMTDTEQADGWAHAPVIHVRDWDWDMRQWEESGMPAEDDSGDSEDENAESYYANSYPDEEDEHETDDEFVGSYERRASTSRSRGARGWDEEEYDVDDYDSDEDHSVGSFGAVAASRRAAQAFLRAALERRGAQQPSGNGKAPTHKGRTASSRLQHIM